MSWLTEFNQEIRERFLAFLWRQWAQLGLASAQVEHRDNWVIDPEALFLTTSVIGRYDPRLFDEMLDWLVKNAHFVNMPRAKSLQRRFDFGVEDRVLAAVCETVRNAKKRLNWRVPCEIISGEPESFFTFGNSSPGNNSFGPEDPIFREFGYSRGPVELRGLSRRFNGVMPECLLLRLRALIGVTARAEILAYLLTHKSAHPSGIAADTGFSQKNINDALVDMEASGIVHSGPLQGRTKIYFIREKEHYPFLHNPGMIPRWICWPSVFAAMLGLQKGIEEQSNRENSLLVFAGELMKLVKTVQPDLQKAGFDSCFTDLRNISGESYIEGFLDAVTQLFERLDERDCHSNNHNS